MIVFCAPNYSKTNPYQRLLAEALGRLGVTSVFHEPNPTRWPFPLVRWIFRSRRKVGILHLHWIDHFIPSKNPVKRMVQGLLLACDVLLVSAIGHRFVWTIHNIEAHDVGSFATDHWIKRIAGLLARSVIVHSHSAKRLAEDRLHIAGRKISVIPQGHYRGVYGNPCDRQQARQALGLPMDRKVFLFLGMIRPYKGLEDLLGVWRHAMSTWPDQPPLLLVAGQAKDDAHASTLQELLAGLEDTVRFDRRWIPDAELPRYLAAADIAVFPFRKITNSGSVLLAMTYGVPVLAPDFDVLREMLGDAAGLLYPPGEAGLEHALAHAMVADLEDVRAKTVVACASLDWDTVARRTLDAYRGAA